MRRSNPEHSLRATAVIAVLFGLATIASGGRVLFGSDAVRQTAGATVGFVVWFNFLAGFAYVVAGLGLWLGRRWAVPWAALIALATAMVFAVFAVHVWTGGAYELRTAAAMTVRLAVWAGIAWVGYRRLWRSA
jgi:hypothetical protein